MQQRKYRHAARAVLYISIRVTFEHISYPFSPGCFVWRRLESSSIWFRFFLLLRVLSSEVKYIFPLYFPKRITPRKVFVASLARARRLVRQFVRLIFLLVSPHLLSCTPLVPFFPIYILPRGGACLLRVVRTKPDAASTSPCTWPETDNPWYSPIPFVHLSMLSGSCSVLARVASTLLERRGTHPICFFALMMTTNPFCPFTCTPRAVLICCAWCWLNAMLIIIAWCIEKYRKRRELQLGAAKVDDGGEDGKVVHATMCGTLASVVCTSDVTSSGE